MQLILIVLFNVALMLHIVLGGCLVMTLRIGFEAN